jgi:hypothetical protein
MGLFGGRFRRRGDKPEEREIAKTLGGGLDYRETGVDDAEGDFQTGP